jgi:threonine dehydratase
MSNRNLTLKDFHDARSRIAGSIHVTPVQSATLIGREMGIDLYLKCENLQKTGSFKVRGALNTVLGLGPDAREHGVITVSAGNHAQALAWAAQKEDISCTVVMPDHAQQTKIDASRGYGAEVILHDSISTLFERAFAIADDENLTFVHPFDAETTVTGHGSAGLEILEQVEDIDSIVVAVGGGGLISGIATAVKLINPAIKIYGVEPAGANVMRRSLDAGKALKVDSVDTIADGLAAPLVGELNFALVQKYVEDVITIEDSEIVKAMIELLSRGKLLAEPAGAAAFAALRCGAVPFRKNDRIVAVISGGNIDIDSLKTLLS